MEKTLQKNSFGKLSVLFVIILTALLPTAWAQVIEDGTEEHPFLIESKQELLDFQTCMNTNADFYHNGSTFVTTQEAGYVTIKAGGLMAGSARAHFKLTTDIVLNQGKVAQCECECTEGSWENWIPLKSFSGSFDGNYHTISGLYCVWPEGNKIGLFEEVSNGEVKNLGIANSYVKGNRYVGGIAGEIIDYASISHCFFWGTIESMGDNCGGITGTTLNSSIVRDCYTTGTLYARYVHAGNIVGFNMSSCAVQNCYSSMWSMSESGLFGAVCGRNEGSVLDCYYDKQMTMIDNNLGTAKLTTEIANSSFTFLGVAFAPRNNAYPVLSGFDYDNNPYVRLSVVPVYLRAASSTDFEDADHIHTDFTVGIPSGGIPSISSWNTAASFVAPNQVHLIRHGVIDFSITIQDSIARLWGFESKVWPYLGTDINPFTIDSLENLITFRNGINGGERFKYKCIWVYPNELDNIHWLQTVDIDLSSESNYTPCGIIINGDSNLFHGFYDGGHHKISNLQIASTTNSNVGFFGCVQNADIRNIEFVNPDVSGLKYVSVLCGHSLTGITVDSCTVRGGTLTSKDTACGAICALAHSSTSQFTHCMVEDLTVQTTMGKATPYTGGICGGILNGNATFSDCSVKNTSILGRRFVGGICGYVSGNCTVTQCTLERGTVNSVYFQSFKEEPEQSFAGGVCGSIGQMGTVTNVTVTATQIQGSANCVGGVCGSMNSGTISNCSILDTATVKGNSVVGGICGYIANTSSTSNITNCTNRAKAVTGKKYKVGGICGDTYGFLNITNCSNYCYVKGDSLVGGIFAGNGGGSYDYDHRHIIEYCYNAGKIDLSGSVGGGIIGSDGTVNHCINTGVVKGKSLVGGIGGGLRASDTNDRVKVNYSMNTADVYCENYGAGIAFNGTSTHCVNYGNVIPVSSTTAGITEYGISSSAGNSYNVGRIWGIENARTSGNNGENVYYDADFVGDQYSKADGIGLDQSQMIGTNSAMKSALGNSQWLYEDNRYPRLKWTNDYDWARDIAIAASQPVLLGTEPEDANNVMQGVKLYGCNDGVTWRMQPPAADGSGGCIFTNNIETLACMGNAIIPTVTSGDCRGFSTVEAVLNDSVVKRVMLRPSVSAPHDTLTIDNLEELQAFRDSINAGEPFHWKGYSVPRFAAQTSFRLTSDITMPISSWTPIGNNYTVFRGHFVGGSHTISGLRGSGDDAGLFCHVSGIIRDLNFTDVTLTGNDGRLRGTVCAYLRDGKILNCTAEGTVSSAVGGGIVAWSDGNDTIANCVNNCTLNYTNPSVDEDCKCPPVSGGILGLGTGNTYIRNCENHADINIINRNCRYRSTAGGIVGGCSNHNYTTGKVMTVDCLNEGNIKANYAGGIIGRGNVGSSATSCINRGDIECGFSCNKYPVEYHGGGGGIIAYGVRLVVSNCTNEGNVKYSNTHISDGGVAGIVGHGGYEHYSYKDLFNHIVTFDYLSYDYEDDVVEHCINGGVVEGLDVAGINCRGNARYCANYGEIKGLNTCLYVAGICTRGTADSCYNVATITALAGNSLSERFVGGVCAKGAASYSYNAGQVYGYNSKYVGGIVGVGSAQYCYNSNTVRSTGTHQGSIVGKRVSEGDDIQTDSLSRNSYYDKQMCPIGAIDGADDNAFHVVGRSTVDMIGTGLQGLIGTNSVWTFTSDFYPQLKDFANTPPSLSSVMPVLLQNDENVLNAHSSFYMKGCNIGEWHVLQGASLRLDTLSVYHQCEGSVVGLGIVKLGAAVEGRIYRQDRIIIGISEDAPYIIKNLTEMHNFRDVINENGFYNMADSTFHLTLNQEDSTHLGHFAEIQNGGLDLFFKLVTNLDMSTEYNWIPVGAYNTDNENESRTFQGTFMGNNRTISHLTILAGDYKGLFGMNNAGEIRDLNIRESKIIGSGYCRAILCASNFGGLIKNCAVTNSKINIFGAGSDKSQSLPTGFLCGMNEFATILKSRVLSDSIRGNNIRSVGGICGMQNNAVVDSCDVGELMASGKIFYFGGVCGINQTSAVLNSRLMDALFNMEGNYVGGICGENEQSSAENGVHNCTNTRSVIRGVGGYYGGIAGSNGAGVIKSCSVSGGTIASTSSMSNVGGITGSSGQISTTEHCFNENPVSGGSYVGGICGHASLTPTIIACINRGKVVATDYGVGGIVGYSDEGVYIDSCGNYGMVSASNRAGGVLGYHYDKSGFCRINNSYNQGKVTTTGNYAGGIMGGYKDPTNSNYSKDVQINNCYNTGDVAAGGDYSGGLAGFLDNDSRIRNSFNTGVVTGRNCLGGLGGCLCNGAYAQQSYNAGIVKGMSQVGGLVGFLESPSSNNTQYNYNIGWVDGVSLVGAICGYSTDQSRLTNNAFDYQMCFFGPVSNNPHSGSTALLTNQMLGNGLQQILNSTTDWTYVSGLYPQVKAWENSAASIASVSPVMLPATTSDTLRADGLPADTYENALGNSSNVLWVNAQGYTLSVNGNSFTGTAAERVRLGATIDGDTLKKVQLLINISLHDSVEIKDRIQLKKFRDLVNSGQTFFYDPTLKEFRESESTFYQEIPPYGDRTYFLLTSDIDLSLESEDWMPVGNYGTSLATNTVNMNTGTTSLNIGDVIAFYDDGGPLDDYSNSKTLTHTFTATGNGKIGLYFISGAGQSGSEYDYIYVHDGTSTGSNILLNRASLNNLAGRMFTSSGSSLTIYFRSNNGTVGAGWRAVVWRIEE